MRKIISVIFLPLFISCLLVGCQSTPEVDTDTITIWHDKEDAVAEALQEYLNEAVPDVKVILEKKTGLTESLKLVGNDPNSAPDMYLFAHDKIGVYAEMGLLSPITDFVTVDQLDSYIDTTIEAATYEGEIYQLPIYFETLLFMYNRKYMDDDEVPQTTEELYAYMVEHTAGGHYGFIEQHSTAYYGVPWVQGFGGIIVDEEGDPQLNSTEVAEALQYHLKFVELMPNESEYTTVSTLFNEGKAHSTIGGPWVVTSVREGGMDLGIAPMPVVDETGLSLLPYVGVQGVQVLKFAGENKSESVTKVLEALLDPQIGIVMAEVSSSAPANNDSYSDESVANNDMIIAMKETAEKSVPIPNIPEMDIMWTVFGNLLTDVNLSKLDISDSVQEAQNSALELIRGME